MKSVTSVRRGGEAIDDVGDSPAHQQTKANRRRAGVRVNSDQYDHDRDDHA